jgi:signal transduction histidine kinase
VPVFDPFIRLDESRGRKTGGHGLGLAIVAGIARLHHGEVKVEASPWVVRASLFVGQHENVHLVTLRYMVRVDVAVQHRYDAP